MHVMRSKRLVVVGGGAAGFFAAIACAEANPNVNIQILEQSSELLSKVRISGGGRCNVTHACFDPRELSGYYPRGGNELCGAFRQFQPQDTIAWFEALGVKLKTESDGRIFPQSDQSETIVECLINRAKQLGIQIIIHTGVMGIESKPQGGFIIKTSTGNSVETDLVLLATGGCRTLQQGKLPVCLGHSLIPPVPSLFGFQLQSPDLHDLAGISVDVAEVSIPQCSLSERGELLITHRGLSGPVILKLSSWGARLLHELNYEFSLHINWLPEMTPDQIASELSARRRSYPSKLIANWTLPPIPLRLWEFLILSTGIPKALRYADLSKLMQHKIIQQMIRFPVYVSGKSQNKSEFVTCGGVALNEVNFKTMESRKKTGLYFAGELLDIDGLTGGFNFQAAWTTGNIAGRSMAISCLK